LKCQSYFALPYNIQKGEKDEATIPALLFTALFCLSTAQAQETATLETITVTAERGLAS